MLAGLAYLSPVAQAFNFGTQSVNSGQTTAYGYGSLVVSFTTAQNNSWVKIAGNPANAGYTDAFFNSTSNSAHVRSNNTTSTSYANVSRTYQIVGSTAGPWNGKVHTCVDIAWHSDPCSGWASGRA